MRARPGLKLGVATSAAFLVLGCTVGPDFKRPQAEPPPTWSSAASSASEQAASRPRSDEPFDGRDWWTVFHDPLLDRLVEEAGAQNLDLQTAVLRIAAARAQREQVAGALYPEVSGSGVAGRTRMSQNSPFGGSRGGSADGGAPPALTNLFQVGFDALWELDLWGGTRRGVEAASADIQSAEHARHEAQASLYAEVARAYLDVRGVERQLAIARANIETQQRLLELVDSQQRAGLASQSEVAAQATQLQAAQAQLPPLEQALAQARNQLAQLLALPPGALDERLAAPAASSTLPPEVPVGLPSELLRRRPDVRQREAELHAATARVGVAEAKLFPSVTLAFAGGFLSSHASSLTDWASRFWLGGGQVSVPIFQGGQLRAQVTLAGIDAQRAALAYRQTVLGAFHDADNALIAYGREQQHAAALDKQLSDARRSRDLARARWRNGLAAFIEVLDAERVVEQSEQQLAQSTLVASTDLVALFKALGGGWQEEQGVDR